MLKTIKHAINLVRHSLRDVGTGAKRSSKWPTVEKHLSKYYRLLLTRRLAHPEKFEEIIELAKQNAKVN